MEPITKEQIIEDLLKGYDEIRKDLNYGCKNAAEIVKKLTAYTETHKWLINEKIPFEVSLEQAFFSWYENVYRPVQAAIAHAKVFAAFPKKEAHEIFDMVSEAFLYLQKNEEKIATPVLAAYRVVASEAESVFHRFLARLAGGGKKKA